MNVILYWLSQQVIWISAICLIGALGYAATAVIAKRRRDIAQFTLEREIYHQRMSRAFLVTALFLALAATVFVVNTNWNPADAPTDVTTPTPSSGLFTLTPEPVQLGTRATLTNTDVITQSESPSVVISAPDAPAPAAEGAESGAPTPIPQELLQPNCPSPGSQLTSPVAGSNLSGIVSVAGTADTNAFSYYRFEVIFPGSNVANFIAQIDQSVDNGVLGSWDVSDPSRYPPGGPYRFQLVVVDIYGNTITCTIPVNIVSQQE
jgi:hypothetical protein